MPMPTRKEKNENEKEWKEVFSFFIFLLLLFRFRYLFRVLIFSPLASEPAREWESARAKVEDRGGRSSSRKREETKVDSGRDETHEKTNAIKTLSAAPPPPSGPNGIRGVGTQQQNAEHRTPSVPRVKLVLLGDSVRRKRRRLIDFLID